MLRMVAPGKPFRFVATELPLALAPPVGRHLLRGDDGEARTVVVVDAPPGRRRRLRRTRRQALPREPVIELASITVVDALPQAGTEEALRWVDGVAVEAAIDWAVDAIDRVLLSHRLATADPDVHALSRGGAAIWIAGFGTGEQVAQGQWTRARELSPKTARGPRRSEALRADERLPALLGGESPLLAEELTLRARSDLDRGATAHAAVGLELALRAAVAELERDERPDLRGRAAELRGLHTSVRGLADDALAGERDIARDTLAGALVRLEAALRARSAGERAAAKVDAIAAEHGPERKA